MAERVTRGVLTGIIKKDRLNQPTCLYIRDVRREGEGCECSWSDGEQTIRGRVSPPELAELLEKEGVENGGVLRVSEYICNFHPDFQSHYLIAYALEIVSKSPPQPKEEVPRPAAGPDGAQAGTPGGRERPAATPRPALRENNAAAFKTPAAKAGSKLGGTPGPTPPSTGRKSLQPIQALNPYNNNWTIRARITSKGQLRTVKQRDGATSSVFSVTMVDDTGTEIEGTFWRDLADRFNEKLQVGKVYYFTKGRVKPANRTYSSARNDYAIDFTAETLIEQTDEGDVEKMRTKVVYTKLNGLTPFLGRRTLADIVAVVKTVSPLGSIKRKSDGQDLPRRDVTLVDSTAKEVNMTLWGAIAEGDGARLEREQDSHPVVSVSCVRVGDYDGLSLSTISRSEFIIDPPGREAEDLRAWWDAEGSSTTFDRVGDGLSSGRSRDGQSSERVQLAAVVVDDDALPPPDAKPQFSSVKASVMMIEPDQKPFFYSADPASGKKVVKDGDGWRLAATDQPCAAMQWRYFMRVTVMDSSASIEVHLSNDQAEKLLGRKADEMHELLETDPARFQTMLKAAQFSEWAFTIKASTSEYQGKLRQRLHGCGRIAPVDFAAESKLLLSKIQRQGEA